jgi:hypothetical protein
MTFSPDPLLHALGLTLPQPPALRGTWAPLAWEPMAGGGERLAVAIAARAETGESEVFVCLRKDTARALYGKYGDNVMGLIALAAESLAAHLAQGGPLSAWDAPLSGFLLGQERPFLADDLKGAIKQGLLLTASLASLADVDAADDEEEAADNRGLAARWQDAVKDRVTAVKPGLEGAFGVSLSLYQKGLPVHLGFLSPAISAHFEVIRPDIAMNRINASRQKLWVLEQTLNAAESESAMLFVLLTQESDLLYSQKQHETARDVLDELILEASARGLSVRGFYSAGHAAETLLQKAA